MPNGDPIGELREEVDRWKRAHQIACANIAELSSQRAKLTGSLTHGLLLIDALLTEMRLANVTPSATVIVSKAEFERQMRILLGHDRDEKPVPAGD